MPLLPSWRYLGSRDSECPRTSGCLYCSHLQWEAGSQWQWLPASSSSTGPGGGLPRQEAQILNGF